LEHHIVFLHPSNSPKHIAWKILDKPTYIYVGVCEYRVYEITIKEVRNREVQITCSCEQFKSTCKHVDRVIYGTSKTNAKVLDRIHTINNICQYSKETKPHPSRPPLQEPKPVCNSECIICLGEFEGCKKTIWCSNCGNHYHEECFLDYKLFLYDSNQALFCPCCQVISFFIVQVHQNLITAPTGDILPVEENQLATKMEIEENIQDDNKQICSGIRVSGNINAPKPWTIETKLKFLQQLSGVEHAPKTTSREREQFIKAWQKAYYPDEFYRNK